ncbi:MAG TPA: heavy metal translocating P-type ATPase, partial [Actinomycetota bacterium]
MAPLRGSLVPLALSAAAVFRAPFTPLFLTAGALPIFVRAGEAIFRRRTLDVHTLDAAAALVLAGQGQFQTASVMVCMVAVGDFIRDLTMQHAERALEEPFNGQLRYAWVVRGETKVRVLVSELDASDEVVVYPGELIPVDGTVVRGRAAVDQQVLTGESMPIDKEAGDEVYAGTVVRDGKLYLDAVRVGEETAAARVLQIVRDAPARETRAQNYAERFANRIVPYSFAGAAASMAITANAGRAASLLIVDYGTGIRVSAPTAVLSSMAWAARRGILVKGGRHLETLAEADTIVFDKTGTLTMGRPAVLDILACTDRFSPDEVLALAAATEQRFTHPVAEAITRAAHDRSIEIPNRECSEYQIGLGVEATVGGRCVRVGGERFMADGGVSLDVVAQRLAALNGRAASSLLVAIDGQLAGLVVVADPVRSEAPSVVRALRERGVREIVMLTGDHESVARRVGDQVGIQSVIAGVLPEEKASIVRHLRAERRGAVVVVGDGINDSPA